MIKQQETDPQERLAKFIQHLEAGRKLQHDWMNYGLECVDIYVEDVNGDWLERWGEDEDEDELEIAAPSNTLANGELRELVRAFLESDDAVAVKFRQRLGRIKLSEVAASLAKCLTLAPEEDQILKVKNMLAGSVRGSETYWDFSERNDDEIELFYLAKELLEKLVEIRGESGF